MRSLIKLLSCKRLSPNKKRIMADQHGGMNKYTIHFHGGKVCTMLTDQCHNLPEALDAAIERFGGERVTGVSDYNAKLLQPDTPRC